MEINTAWIHKTYKRSYRLTVTRLRDVVTVQVPRGVVKDGDDSPVPMSLTGPFADVAFHNKSGSITKSQMRVSTIEELFTPYIEEVK